MELPKLARGGAFASSWEALTKHAWAAANADAGKSAAAETSDAETSDAETSDGGSCDAAEM